MESLRLNASEIRTGRTGILVYLRMIKGRVLLEEKLGDGGRILLENEKEIFILRCESLLQMRLLRYNRPKSLHLKGGTHVADVTDLHCCLRLNTRSVGAPLGVGRVCG